MAHKSFVNTYSRLDRILHRMAFASGGLQEAVADIEDRLNGRALARVPLTRPVFITALPRAGTTMLLSLLYETGEFATHTYRSMPFVLCPLTWHKLSGVLRTHDSPVMERAHGDGITISPDSAEAFEEMLWQQFFGDHYQEYRIRPWETLEHPDFARFFENHIRKQLLLGAQGAERRYLSKNNMNVARLPVLRHLYPDADILVPYRNPVQQASSLLRQHRRFLELHEQDPFSRQYMRGIGHYDFGANLLPINFDDWMDRDRRDEASTLSFWLEYWQTSYRYVLKHADRSVNFISFDALVESPGTGLEQIAESAGLNAPTALTGQADKLRKTGLHNPDLSQVATELQESVFQVLDELDKRSVVRV